MYSYYNSYFSVEANCRPGWTELSNKCLKVAGKRVDFETARQSCHSENGELFFPKNIGEITNLKHIASKLKINWKRNKIWIGFIRHHPFSKAIPPVLVAVNGLAAPKWVSSVNVWTKNLKTLLRLANSDKRIYVRSYKGEWILAELVIKILKNS